MSKILVAPLLGACLLLAYGCGSGYSDDRAKQQCDIEKQNNAETFDSKSYASCLACYEECGDDCVPNDNTPDRYSCPGDPKPSKESGPEQE